MPGDSIATNTAGKSKRKHTKKTLLRHALHQNLDEDGRTVFVGNLPNTIQKRVVEKMFKKCGAIEAVRIRCQALTSANEKSQNVGRAIRVLRKEIRDDPNTSAVAYVLFKNVTSVRTALQVNGVVYGNRHIIVTTLDA
uniref:RNA-binding protein 34 n=1 Tax=Lygus hesperus TaxID=30085 RepID=A0A0A9ZF65_LYGHE